MVAIHSCDMFVQQPPNKPHCVTSQKMAVCSVSAVKNKNLAIQLQIYTK